MSEKWFPVINYESCNSCGTCVDFCNNNVYSINDNKVEVNKPENCEDGCKGCEPICPTDSITHSGDDNSNNKSTCCCCGDCCS